MEYYSQLYYLRKIQGRLPHFKDKGHDVYNCRCVVCGDSHKDTAKARGYFFKKDNTLFYKCHNCGASMSFVAFLKEYFPADYQEMIYEEFSSSSYKKKELPKIKRQVRKPAPQQQEQKPDIKPLILPFKTMAEMPESNPERQYLVKRGLSHALKLLYYIPNAKEYSKTIPRYQENPCFLEDAAIGIPHWGKDKTALNFMQLRFINQPKIRYMTLQVTEDENTHKIFGLERAIISEDKVLSVTEGAFDSLFVRNCIAISGITDWHSLKEYQPLVKSVRFIIDNDFTKNKQVKKNLVQIINSGFEVVIMPKSYIRYKDVNDLYLSGKFQSGGKLNDFLDENTFKGQEAVLKLSTY